MQKTPPEGSQSEGWSPRPAHPPALRIRGLMEGADGRGWWKGLVEGAGCLTGKPTTGEPRQPGPDGVLQQQLWAEWYCGPAWPS